MNASTPAVERMASTLSHSSSLDNGLLYRDLLEQNPEQHTDEPHQLYIRTPQILRYIQVAHNATVEGHFGAAMHYMAVRQHFILPGIWQEVPDYTIGCDTCAWVNQRAGKVVGIQQPLPVGWARWEHVGVDFILDLQTSPRANHCIVTCVEHFSKWAHQMSGTKTIDTEHVAQSFIEAAIQLHGVLHEIVRDRDTCFTSDFWEEVSKRLQTHVNRVSPTNRWAVKDFN